MAIQIIKKGIADTIQDIGRYGYQHLGIQANGFLDYQSARLANYIVGNPLNAPIFEIHFPAILPILKAKPPRITKIESR